MKVLHISSVDIYGAGQCCVRINNALREAGVESKVLVQEKFGVDENVIPYYPLYTKCKKGVDLIMRKMGLYMSERNKVLWYNLHKGKHYSLPTSYSNLLGHPLVREADIINLHWINGFVDIPSFVSRIDKPIVFTLHDENFFYGLSHYSKHFVADDPMERKYYEMKKMAYAKNKDYGIIFLSKYMQEKYSEHEFVKGRQNTVINNAVDLRSFMLWNKEEVRNDLGIPCDKYVISFMATSIDDPQKGLKDLIEAVETINNSNIIVLAIGSDAGIINSKYLEKVGKQTDVNTLSKLLSASDLFVQPSYQEAFAQSPIEAMACGVPAVVYPFSGSDELAEKSVCIRCNDFSVNELVNAISVAMDRTHDPEIVRKDIELNFSPSHLAQQYIEFYESILKKQ